MQYSTSNWPQTAIAYKGNAFANGVLAGPKDSYFTVGGYFDIADAYNTLDVIPFGSIVSTLATSPNLFVQGVPTTSYLITGVVVIDESVLQNEPFKPGGILKGAPCTALTQGFVRYNTWQKVNTPTPIDPVKGCAVVYDKTSGEISFTATGTTTTGNFVKLANTGIPSANVISVDPVGGLTATGTSVLVRFNLQ